MYIHRLIFRDVRNFAALDLLLWNDWTQQPLQSVLVTGPNGTGKATLLRAIAGLWENFGNWIHLRRALNADQMAQRSLLLDAGLAAVEIRGLQPFPVWLFVASTPAHWEELQSLVADTTARFVGEVRGGRGRPQFVPAEDDNTAEWLRDLTERKERAELGTATPEALPNLLFWDAETRTIITPQRRASREATTEPLFKWFRDYEPSDRWDGHLETMIRNLKIRDPNRFRTLIAGLNHFLGDGKKLTDFDDNLRLRVQIGKQRSNAHYIDDLSAGERQCLILLFMVERWLMDGGVVLIDEPDLHLHVSLQRQFIRDLETLVTKRHGQIIVTSHSPTLWEEYSDRQRVELGARQPVNG